ncbi:MAG: hypothetical protein JO093_11035 [Acidobacteria bacterium]|nr:hypothetical protein [Acidobacteriota bacterium]MBV9067955.1 hypothetical protein [Acidobacteriota bacterium]MBV9186151.1 hypothetical protein [Acidobacteriota bacterium]
MLTGEYARVLAVVTIAGFGVQQLLQLLDPFIMIGIAAFKSKHVLPVGMTDVDFKKAVVGGVGTVIGLIVALATHVKTLCYVLPGDCGLTGRAADLLLSALVIGAGTEGANTLVKYFAYVKDARKQDLALPIRINPPRVQLSQGQSVQFRASVDDNPHDVSWSVVPSDGGVITSSGIYTAPTSSGTFLVLATSTIDSALQSIATVIV